MKTYHCAAGIGVSLLALQGMQASGMSTPDQPEQRIQPARQTASALPPAMQQQMPLQELKNKADCGDAQAQLDMGKHCIFGNTQVRNFNEAWKYFCKAADQNLPKGKLYKGVCLLKGWGTTIDVDTGIDLVLESAIAGDSEALCLVGDFYQSGMYFKQNSEIALRWIRKSADLGNSEAQQRLHQMLPQPEATGAARQSEQSAAAQQPAQPQPAQQQESVDRAGLAELIAEVQGMRPSDSTGQLYQTRLLTLLPMIANGADVNLTLEETKGNTALHYACGSGNYALVKWLLEHGANPNAVTNKGATPMQCAGGPGGVDIRGLLQQYGAH